MHPYLEENILKDYGPGDCWGWRGPTGSGGGYPLCNFGGEKFSARTLVYEIHFGKLKSGRKVTLSCGNTCCLNPNHMNKHLGVEAPSIPGKN